ncbi:MAG: hypothetical protein N3F07_00885 [Candidatus Micrarchaeota archaeon]|nr:hypothetical protein [Candidatus Micrarchaeota archaeon]
MAEEKKEKQALLESLPDGLKEIADIPQEKLLTLPAKEQEKQELLPSQQQKPALPERPRTQKEKELDELIAARQSIIEQLKEKNPKLAEARKQIASLLPSLKGKGAGKAVELMREEERIEFSIATEAYTPKQERELLKRLRAIRAELSQHKELDAIRKQVEEKRAEVRALASEIKELEKKLAEARAACDAKYAEVLAERKAAYEKRQRERAQKRQERLSSLLEARKRKREKEMAKYMKAFDDTVSMDEIVQIERKEKKSKK